MKDINKIMQQAQEMQNKMAEIQQNLSSIEVSGNSGGGVVEVTLSGKGDAKKIKIDPSVFDSKDIEVLEDLVVAAINDARAKLEKKISEEMSKVTGGLKLPPGMNFPS
jgi:DNA-binding YbaB/EbfC family protein|tara:strand:+ start:1742 stop:2065 length:324 start_codon:yes stop_codon:yes gene_type:complete